MLEMSKVRAAARTEPDFSREETKRAWDRAHAPWQCLLCGEYISVGTPHRHYENGWLIDGADLRDP